MSYERTERIRRAAILVASLDEALAEQMLASLPAGEAKRVLDEVDRLDEIDSEEQSDVLEEFRRLSRSARDASSGVEFAYADASQNSGTQSPAPLGEESNAASGVSPFSLVEASTIAEMLSCEHPQTIAAALSRLDDESGADVFAALPETLQPEVLERLSSLQAADEDAVLEVESQLLQRVEQQRERRERAAAGVELARRILAKTPPAKRAALLERIRNAGGMVSTQARISGVNSQLVETSTAMPTATSQASNEILGKQAANLAAAVSRRSRGAANYAFAGPLHSMTVAQDKLAVESHGVVEVLEDRSLELEQMSDHALIDALRIADERTVQCAMAASSDRFVNRVVRLLPRRDAKRLRRLLRALGPTRIADLRFAQHEFLRMAGESTAFVNS